MKNKLLIEQMKEEGYSNLKEIPGRGLCGLQQMIFTVGLTIGLDEYGYSGRYCYPNLMEAKNAINSWDGKDDPPGPWIKYKGRGGERSDAVQVSDTTMTSKEQKAD